MGPSGSGKSTLMHCLAGLDTVTSGQVFIGDVDLATLNDKELTAAASRPDRLRLPVVQPGADADARARTSRCRWTSPARKPDKEWFDTRRRHGRPARPARPPAQRALRRPAAARRLRPGAGQPTRRSCSPTSRPATSTRGPAPRCSASCGGRCASFGQTIVMVTHDPIAASYADRVLFLADGRIVDDDDEPDGRGSSTG